MWGNLLYWCKFLERGTDKIERTPREEDLRGVSRRPEGVPHVPPRRDVAHDTNKYFKANSNARIFFISEGKPHEFEEFRTIVPSTEWRLDDAWKDALWTMAKRWLNRVVC